MAEVHWEAHEQGRFYWMHDVTSTILVIDARFLRTWKRRVGGAGTWPPFFDVPFL